ncbi:phage tail tip lysozyme [Reyranella sp.]|uniref:phage tail tip lysozyme n=1 Tax=Reyranella sp. TaxID=1929291 RepID=UPI003D101D4C
MADELEERRFELDAEIKRRELAIKEAEIAKKTGLSTAQATVAGATLALISGLAGALISAWSTRDIEGGKALASQAIEQSKVQGTLKLEQIRQEATLALEQKKFETNLIFEAIKQPSREDSIRNLQFFVAAGFIADKDGKISKLPLDKLPSSPSPVAGVAPKEFDRRALETHVLPTMRSLIADFGLADFQAAAVVGNFAQETNGFRSLKQVGMPDGQGGIGYAQWDASRRVAFLNFVQTNSLDPMSATANYQFVKQELQTTEAKALARVKMAASLEDATVKFEVEYTRSGAFKHFEARIEWARLVLQGFRETAKAESR